MNRIFVFALLLFVATCFKCLASSVISVVYDNEIATIDIPQEIEDYFITEIESGDVVLLQIKKLPSNLTISLSGETPNGSFEYEGDQDVTILLKGVNIASEHSYAIKIDNKNQTTISLQDDSYNILSDAHNGSQNACLICKGACEIVGNGTLIINGHTKQAYKSKSNLKISNGNIYINSYVKDGINLDGTLEIHNGLMHITTSGSGYWDIEDLKTKAPSCINSNQNIIIEGGSLKLSSTGDGGKCINCDSCLIINAGMIEAITTGRRYIDPSVEHLRDTPDLIPDSLCNSPKAIKAEYNITINNGKISIFTSEDGGEGIESKNTLNLNGGSIQIDAFDDCINAQGDIYINGGNYKFSSADNDGIDTNGSLYISGGNVITLGNHVHELGIDVNDKSKSKKLYITGGTIISIGGTSQVAYPYTCESAQPTLIYKGCLSYSHQYDVRNDEHTIMSYINSRDYAANEICMIISSPHIKIGETYSLFNQTLETEIARVDAVDVPYSNMQSISVFSYDTFTSNDITIPFRSTRTAHLSTTELPALVVYLHGGSSRGADNELQMQEPGISSIYNYLTSNYINAIFVVPQCPKESSWGDKTNKVLYELINQLIASNQVDFNRIYLFGGSMGGTGTWNFASKYPGLFSAIMPVAGNVSNCDISKSAQTPVYTVVGAEDKRIDIATIQNFVNEMRQLGNDCLIDIVDNWTHETTCCESYTYERLDWVFSHSKNTNAISSVPISEDIHSTKYFTIDGRHISKPSVPGVYIIVSTLENGNTIIQKKYFKNL